MEVGPPMVDGEGLESPNPTRGDEGAAIAIRAVAQDRVHLAVVTAARRGAEVPGGTGNKAPEARARAESRS